MSSLRASTTVHITSAATRIAFKLPLMFGLHRFFRHADFLLSLKRTDQKSDCIFQGLTFCFGSIHRAFDLTNHDSPAQTHSRRDSVTEIAVGMLPDDLSVRALPAPLATKNPPSGGFTHVTPPRSSAVGVISLAALRATPCPKNKYQLRCVSASPDYCASKLRTATS
jgi:hypothetical protein